jgi:hypothetical protein
MGQGRLAQGPLNGKKTNANIGNSTQKGNLMPADNHFTHTSPFGHVTHEYALPATTMTGDDRGALAPWLAEIVSEAPQRVREILTARWADIAQPCNRSLRDRLLQFLPYSIIRFEKSRYLRLCLPDADRNRVGNSIFVATPLPATLAAERLEEFHLADNTEFAEFLHFFAGLRESMPPLSGSFLYDEEWQVAENIVFDGCEDFDDWKTGVVIYGATNGDCLVLHPVGRVAWFAHEENCFGNFFSSFGEFLNSFVRHNREFEFPFDSFGGPEHGRR